MMHVARVFPLKLVGTISLGLLTGVSYTLSNITVFSILSLPSASDASVAFAQIKLAARKTIRRLTTISTFCLLGAHAFSPRGFRHPYLLWTSLLVVGSSYVEKAYNLSLPKATIELPKPDPKRKGKMEASYEVLGDSHSDGTPSASDDEDVNGEEVKSEMVAFGNREGLRFYVVCTAFVMSVVGIWGDGAR